MPEVSVQIVGALLVITWLARSYNRRRRNTDQSGIKATWDGATRMYDAAEATARRESAFEIAIQRGCAPPIAALVGFAASPPKQQDSVYDALLNQERITFENELKVTVDAFQIEAIALQTIRSYHSLAQSYGDAVGVASIRSILSVYNRWMDDPGSFLD